MPLAPWNAAQTVNTTTALLQFGGKVTQLVDGTIVVTWNSTDGTTDGDVFFQRYDALGNKLGGEVAINPVQPSITLAPDITALTTGGFVISYANSTTGTLAQRYSSLGVPVGSIITLNAPSGGLTNPSRLETMPNGEFAYVYQDSDIRAVIVDASGVPAPAFLVSNPVDQESSPSITFGNGRIGVAWHVNAGAAQNIYVRFFDVNGGSASNAELGNLFVGSAVRQGTHPHIVALNNGTFVVTWIDNTFPDPTDLTTYLTGINVRGQIVRVDALNVVKQVGGIFTINATTVGEQTNHEVTALADGKFIVVYLDEGVAGGVTGSIRAQIMNPDGSRLGGEYVLSQTATFDSGTTLRALPDITQLADGRVTVVWDDLAADPTAGGIKMQILDPREGSYTGTANADKIYGHNGNVDFISGGAGADTINGLAGADTLYGDAGADSLDGGRGDDTLYGGADNDTLDGGLGDDDMFGEAGNDFMYAARGVDTFDGGTGTDTVYYFRSIGGVQVDLATINPATGGDADGDSLINIEQVYGSNGGNDTLTGNGLANYLAGAGGTDTLNGAGGDDTLDGGAGADVLNGGDNFDTAYYYGSAVGVTVNLGTNTASGGDAQGDTFTGIESVQGSNTQGDTLTGNSGYNVLRGWGGADVLNGGGGYDVLYGGGGSDTFHYTALTFGTEIISDFEDGADKLRFNGIAGVDNITDFLITGNGTASIQLQISGQSITLSNSGGLITLTNGDFLFV
jgi:Ca2+-binding RTX toxin-like protein